MSTSHRVTGLEGRPGGQRLDVAERAADPDPLQRELATAHAALHAATQAREALSQELQELAARSAAGRESLSAHLAAVTADADTLRARLQEHEATVAQLRGEHDAAQAERARAQAEHDAERGRLEAERRAGEAEQAELSRRLVLRTDELQATVHRLNAIESATNSLELAITELRAEAIELRSERAQLTATIDTVSVHNEGLRRTAAERDRDLREGAKRESELRARLAQVETALTASEDRVAILDRDRTRTVEDLRRLASSRAWRWGHGTTRVLRRLAFRPIKGEGAVAKMLMRLDSPPALTPGQADGAQEESPEAR